MNSNLKIALALVVLVAAVVGVTVITQYTEPEAARPVAGPADGPTGGMPLVYEDTFLVYDPFSSNYAKREFAGFFEVNAEVHWATYLLRNERAVPVRLSARGRSCTACSQARVAVLSPAENRAVKRDAGVAAAVGGLYPNPPDVALYRLAEAGNKLAWQSFDFDRPELSVEVPAAVDPDTPTWCVLQLGFEVKKTNEPTRTLSATIGLSTADMKAPAEQAFAVGFVADAAARVNPAMHDFGTLAENGEPKAVELYYWSTTRPQSAFAPPVVAGLLGDPFLAASAPVPLSPVELNLLAAKASAREMAVRARGGYKFTVTLRRDNPTPAPGAPRELDIGPVERTLTVAGSDGTTAGLTVRLTGNVTGLVALAGGTSVELGDFPSARGTAKAFRLVSTRPDLELEPVNGGAGESRDRNPTGVTVTADGTPVAENGGKRYGFQLTVAPGALGGAVATQLLVFRVKTTGQLVRIPLKGMAYVR